VSSRHAEIRIADNRLYLKDLKSTNGTYVNGTKIHGEVEIHSNDLIQFATLVFRVGRVGSASENRTVQEASGDRALALMQFDRLINDGNLFPYFQPIVSLEDRQIRGYEVLGRSRLFGLQMPNEMFQAASQLNLESELSEVFRLRGVQVGEQFGKDMNIFVNTHPKELGQERFYRSLADLRKHTPNQTVTLEIHEAAVTDLVMMRELSAILRDLNIRLAFDDFGVGQARLVELAEVRPDYLKFDMKLTKNINQASTAHQKVVSLFAKMVNDLGIKTLAEGVETEECHLLLQEMGFSMGQGYLYGRPEAITKYLKALTDTASRAEVTQDSLAVSTPTAD
jgi:EAL domain-containing protein (putative c-di-GMP-specific phosphodiesterase class I)